MAKNIVKGMNVEKMELGKAGRTYALLLAGYVAFIVCGSLVPWTFHTLPIHEAWVLYHSRLSASLAISSRSNFAANILLFVPLTFLGMGALERGKGGWFQGMAALLWLGVAVILGGGIEFLQVYVPARTASLNDIVAQAIGGAIGLCLWFVVGRGVTRWAGDIWREHVGEDTVVKLLVVYAGGFIVWQLFPFDLTISFHEIYHTLKYRTCLIPFTDHNGLSAYRLLANTLPFLPVGALLATVFRRKGRGFYGMVCGGFAAAAMMEGLQFFAEGHCPSATDVVLGTLGSAIGIFLVKLRPGRPEPKRI